MKIYAFIFARGGSKGLPNKNIKCLGNIPLIGHSINIAKKSKYIQDVYVSTDSPIIKDIALGAPRDTKLIFNKLVSLIEKNKK